MRDFMRELAGAGVDPSPGDASPVAATELAHLPPAALRYMAFMRVVGRPRAWSYRTAFTGRFRAGLDRPWAACEAWQYGRVGPIARYFRMRMAFLGPVPVVARDVYHDGEGHLDARLLDLFPVAHGEGEAFDVGELVTWLNDAVFFAPAMLLDPAVAFGAFEPGGFDLTLTDRGHTVRARVYVDGHGAPLDFETSDRFFADPAHPERPPARTRWSTPVAGWDEGGAQPTFTRAGAVWHLPGGPHAYAELEPVAGALAFNVSPGG